MVDVRDLECLVALRTELHFRRASDRLGMSQPALSKRVQKVEAELGVLLFDRSSGAVTVTCAGVEVLRHAQSMLEAWRVMKRSADDLQRGTRGLVQIGAVGSAFYEALPRLLARAREALPDLELRVEEMETPELVHALHSGEVQLGFLRPPAGYGIEVQTVWVEDLVAAVPQDSDLAARPHLEAADLQAERFIFFGRSAGIGYWDRVAALFHEAGLEFDPQEAAGHVSTILGQVAIGAGVSIVPSSAQRVRIPGVVYVPFGTPTHLPLAVAFNPRSIPLAARLLLQQLPGEPLHPDPLP